MSSGVFTEGMRSEPNRPIEPANARPPPMLRKKAQKVSVTTGCDASENWSVLHSDINDFTANMADEEAMLLEIRPMREAMTAKYGHMTGLRITISGAVLKDVPLKS